MGDRQSVLGSAIETVAQTGVRLVANFLLNLAVLPLFGLPVTVTAAAGITAVFTVSSLVLGFTVRRLFARGR